MTQTEAAHRLAGKTVIIKSGKYKGEEYRVEDLWINVAGQSWMYSKGNPACIIYAMRSVMDKLPCDDNVLYGKIGGLGHLIHGSEAGDNPLDGFILGRNDFVDR